MVLRVALCFVLLVSLCSAAPIVVYLTTAQTGEQTQIDLNHTSTWLFTPNVAFDFGGGLFQMKDGSKTWADIGFSLFLGSDASGQLLGSSSLTHATFCAQVSKCSQFGYHQFFFDTPIQVVPGTVYFASLTSSAADVQKEAYFIKAESFISDQTGTAIDPQPIGSSTANTPEPVSILLTALGLSVCAIRPRLIRGEKAKLERAES